MESYPKTRSDTFGVCWTQRYAVSVCFPGRPSSDQTSAGNRKSR